MHTSTLPGPGQPHTYEAAGTTAADGLVA